MFRFCLFVVDRFPTSFCGRSYLCWLSMAIAKRVRCEILCCMVLPPIDSWVVIHYFVIADYNSGGPVYILHAQNIHNLHVFIFSLPGSDWPDVKYSAQIFLGSARSLVTIFPHLHTLNMKIWAFIVFHISVILNCSPQFDTRRVLPKTYYYSNLGVKFMFRNNNIFRSKFIIYKNAIKYLPLPKPNPTQAHLTTPTTLTDDWQLG